MEPPVKNNYWARQEELSSQEGNATLTLGIAPLNENIPIAKVIVFQPYR